MRKKMAALLLALTLAIPAIGGAVSAEAGDRITLGRWEQDAEPGPDPIRWRVLTVQDGRALVVSESVLDVRPLHTRHAGTAWPDCELRLWLNGVFLGGAFGEEEQQAILTAAVDNGAGQGFFSRSGAADGTMDRLFLLSYAEAWTWLPLAEDRIGVPTEWAVGRGALTVRTEDGTACGWWLRSPGESDLQGLWVTSAGEIEVRDVDSAAGIGVRPAMWVELEKIPGGA